MRRRIYSFLLALAMLISVYIPARAEDASGTCGDSLTWTLNGGTLTISGKGDMADWSHYDYKPWYSYSSRITSVQIENGVTSIGQHAFSWCKNLTEVTISDSVTAIGKDAFYESTGLTEVTIPDSVTGIGNYAFSGCTGLTEVTISDSVTSIGQFVFSRCTGLTGVTIPDSVTSIGAWAFEDCTGLTEVKISDSVASIEYFAFSGCTGLTDVYYGGTEAQWNSVTIGYDNDPLLSAAMHYNAASGGGDVPSGTCGEHLTWTLNGGTLTISGTGDMWDWSVSYSVCDAPWWSYRSSITSVQIGDGVTRIGSRAFFNCEALTGVTIPGSVASIGEYAFYGCTGLTGVTIPDGVTSIGGGAFCNCTGLMRVTIPDSVTSIDYYAFYGCTGLTGVTMADSVASIGYSAFYGCTSLTGVTIPASVTSIDTSVFFGCTALMSVTIPDGVTSIGNQAFCNCENLKSVTIPDSVTSIGDDAFWFCKGLTGVTIPGSVAGIGERAFGGCTGLTGVTIADSVTSIGVAAFGSCTGLTGVTIPASVTSIGAAAFDGCTGLTDVYYGGTKEQWNAVTIGDYNDPLRSATIHCIEPEPTPAVEKPAYRQESVTGGIQITLTCQTSGAAIYYTLDGSAPDTSSARYTAPLLVESNCTLKAVAVLNGVQSAVLSTPLYVGTLTPPVADPPSGVINSGVTVTLESVDGAQIYYTTDGSAPNINSTLYTGGISLNRTTVIRAVAVLSGYRTSAVTEAAYTVNLTDANKAVVRVGSTTARDGDTSPKTLPLIVDTGADTRVRNFQITLRYGSGVKYDGFNPREGIDRLNLTASPDPASRTIRVELKDDSAGYDSGLFGNLRFVPLESATDGTVPITIDRDSAKVIGTHITNSGQQDLTLDFEDGSLTLENTNNTRVGLVNRSTNEAVTTAAQMTPGTYDVTPLSAAERDSIPVEELRTATVFCAVYAPDGSMVHLQSWDVDVTDPNNISMNGEIEIPDGVTVKRIRVFVLSDALVPLRAANMLL